MRRVVKRKSACTLRYPLSRNDSKRKLLACMGSKEKFVPVLVETHKEDRLLLFSRKKFLVPSRVLTSQFSNLIRSELQLPSYQSYTLMLDNTRLPSTMSMGKIYNEHKDANSLLHLTIASENTFGCRAQPVRPVSPEFDDDEVPDEITFFPEEFISPEDLPSGVDVIHLTAVVGNPVTNIEQPVSTALSLSIPNYEEHVTGIVNAIATAIMAAISSGPMQNVMFQSAPDSEITINPQLVKDALLNYMQTHSLSFSAPFDVDNFYTIIKITPANEEAEAE